MNKGSSEVKGRGGAVGGMAAAPRPESGAGGGKARAPRSGGGGVRAAPPGGRAGPQNRVRADGAASRARMLEAAGKLFASQGYTAVSTRALAGAARVNLSAIAYHFGDKEGLYHAVLRQLIAETEPILQPAVEHLGAGVAAAAGDRVQLARIAAGLVRHLLVSIVGNERMRWHMALLLREFQEPSSAFPMLLEERIHPLHNAVAGLVGAATGRAPGDPETRLLTAAVIGQCMMFGAARAVVLARLGWDAYTPERVETIGRTIAPAVLAMLGLPPIDGDAPAEAGGGA